MKLELTEQSAVSIVNELSRIARYSQVMSTTISTLHQWDENDDKDLDHLANSINQIGALVAVAKESSMMNRQIETYTCHRCGPERLTADDLYHDDGYYCPNCPDHVGCHASISVEKRR